MKTKTILIILTFFLGSILLINEVQSQVSISVEGGWSELVNKDDLVSGPGSDLISTYENALNQVSIEITGTSSSSDQWRVDIKKTNNTWDESLIFSVKRTSDGSGDGSISGGNSSYIDVTNSDQAFFSGSGNRNSIYIRYKLSGVSVIVPPKAYSITVDYTIVDI